MEQQRLEKLCGLMRERGIDQMVITSPANLYYLTGKFTQPMERLLALVVDRDGNAVYYANKIFLIDQSIGAEVVTFSDTDDGMAPLAKGVRETGTVAIDKNWTARFLLQLIERRPRVRYLHDCTILEELRMVKDLREIEALRQASRISDKVLAALHDRITDGMAERDVYRISQDLYTCEGGTNGGAMVQFGKNSADPHSMSGPTVVQPGDSIVIDTGVNYRRYRSDMTRTVFFRGVPPELEKAYGIVLAANRAGVAAVRPGAPLHTVDDAARGLITEAGYGPRFIHRTGHSIGLDMHEPPDVSAGTPVVMQPGMVFSVEPGIYLPGLGGVRIEDLVLVTEDGCEVLNRLDRALRVLD
ncbi:M24 family metallopeptidase [Anaerotruncus rubiinfantis]|uniref:M24 family metallopeptidase n=1 Tax=Anaerotruncus rubiinfantis TaxID=1720200 RepID=UPI00082C4971|nr:Xaa-Pro peptidase family protein [Anaerotruncus rubiinfantis]